MDILNNYEAAVKAIANHVGYEADFEAFGANGVEIDRVSLFTVADDSVGWAETIEDLTEQDGDYYEEEIRGFYRGEVFSAALIDFQREKYWRIFMTKNEIK